jgi:hypothetical protein
MAAVMSPSKVHCNFIEKNPWSGNHSKAFKVAFSTPKAFKASSNIFLIFFSLTYFVKSPRLPLVCPWSGTKVLQAMIWTIWGPGIVLKTNRCRLLRPFSKTECEYFTPKELAVFSTTYINRSLFQQYSAHCILTICEHSTAKTLVN